MSVEVERILRMVEEGKINAAEGTELIQIMKDEAKEASQRTQSYSKKSIRIKVLEENVTKVNITVPLKLVQLFLNIGKSITQSIPDAEKYLQDVDLDIISEAIEEQIEGNIIDLETEEGDRVLISIE